MIQTIKSLFFISLITTGASVNGLDLTKLNLSFQYDVKLETNIQYRIVETSTDQLKLLYQIENDTSSLWQYSILGQNGYAATTHDTLSLNDLDTIFIDANRIFYSLMFPKSKYDLLVFSRFNLSEGVYRVYDISLIAPGGHPTFYPLDQDRAPLLSRFTTDDAISFEVMDSSLHVFQYEENFGPADPPMGQMAALAPTLSIDSAYFIGNTPFTMENRHFYLFQKDTLDNTGITILKCPYYYPELRIYEELIKPMRYISTSAENESLNKAGNARIAFEEFWLSNFGTKFRARGAIRFFFNRVEEANLLFTDYKMGWKTDRGILYIIYGKPDIVVKRDRVEEWRYDSGEQFEFIRIPILFTPSLYSLKRNPDYEKSWYNQVGEIRKGQ